MIDTRTDTGVPCVTTLPDPALARFAEHALGAPLTSWQRDLLNRLMASNTRESATWQAAH